ncbi:hypothetical protein WICPIJ_003008 [Wickerhamomyces pijperi]|uniref:Initiation-specific alpha-1,6-mannosyltransferase n=1 Tax=Wickerhamomyces pijperi TaxID=599730 RepID=A0A9P8Q8G8_WICPI|nr:hypothetical protein WICPIJ_003008 [Wickerhamomyces pijperi]
MAGQISISSLLTQLQRQFQKSRPLRLTTYFITFIFIFYQIHSSIYGIKNLNDAHNRKVSEYPIKSKPSSISDNYSDLMTPLDKLSIIEPHSTLRQQLHFQFPYDPNSDFPKQIWQTWKYDLSSPKFKPKFIKYVRQWQDTNQDHRHNLLSDEQAFKLIDTLYSTVPSVLKAFHAMPKSILKADFFRYLILFARGGIYADIDTMSLKPVDTWVTSNSTIYDQRNTAGLVIGVEADPDREDWNVYYAKRVQFCQWTIMSKVGHPALGELIAKITEITLEKLEKGELNKIKGKDAGDDIMNWTGPGIFTDEIFQYLNYLHDTVPSSELHIVNHIPDNEYNKSLKPSSPIDWKYFTLMENTIAIYHDVMVLPITSFSPDVGHMGSETSKHPMSFVKHMFEGSWKPEDERHVGDVNNDENKVERRGFKQ